MTSWKIFSCAAVNAPWPQRLVGTCRQYSKNAISQDASTTFHSAVDLKRRCPYQAIVMNMLEAISNPMLFTEGQAPLGWGRRDGRHDCILPGGRGPEPRRRQLRVARATGRQLAPH